MKLRPTQQAKENNPLSNPEHPLRLRMTPTDREPGFRGQRCRATRRVVNKSRLIPLSEPRYLEVKGQRVLIVSLDSAEESDLYNHVLVCVLFIHWLLNRKMSSISIFGGGHYISLPWLLSHPLQWRPVICTVRHTRSFF